MGLNLKIINRQVVATCTAILLTTVLAAGNARADDEFRTETIKFQDLNLNTPAGAEALYGRIHAAALRVCSQSDPIMRAAVGPCARKAEAEAIGKVNQPALTAYYQLKTGRHTETLAARR